MRSDTGQTQVSCFLQVGDDAALVPQQAAVAQFDGGDELTPTGLGLVTGSNESATHAKLFPHMFAFVT